MGALDPLNPNQGWQLLTEVKLSWGQKKIVLQSDSKPLDMLYHSNVWPNLCLCGVVASREWFDN
jgi:hypothetical protein